MHIYLIIPVKKVSAYSFFSLKLQTEMMITALKKNKEEKKEEGEGGGGGWI